MDDTSAGSNFARVAELEALVHQLLENQQAVETVETVEGEAPAEAIAELIAEKKVSEMMADHHATEEEKARKQPSRLTAVANESLLMTIAYRTSWPATLA
jgi:hypothetical protein